MTTLRSSVRSKYVIIWLSRPRVRWGNVGNREGASFVLLYDELPQLKDFVQHGVSPL